MVNENTAGMEEPTLPATINCESSFQSKDRPTVAELAELIELIGAPDGRWIACSPLPEREGYFIQAFRAGPEKYEVEVREGADADIVATTMRDGDAVVSAFLERIRAWAPEEERAWIPATPPQGFPLDDETTEEIKDTARELIHTGFESFSDVVQEVTDMVNDAREEEDGAAITPAQVRRLALPIWQARLEEQATWPAITDNKRLEQAFAALRSFRIVARQNFACCNTCGHAEIKGEAGMEEMDYDGDDEGKEARGFVFYHWQDTVRAPDGGGLYLTYGGFDGSDETTVAIGRDVVAALTEAGLSPEWDGTAEQRIFLDLEWQRPLPA